MSELTAREGVGRRATDSDVAHVEGVLAKKVLVWFITTALAVVFAAGLWAADTRGRIVNLEENQFTDVEAAELTGALNLLRQEITYLRRELERQP